MITKTEQELFDLALTGVLATGLSYIMNGTHPNCQYRLTRKAACPVRCGIGHMIPDELYDVSMEDNSIMGGKGFGIFPKHQLDFLDEVQTAHDDAVGHHPDAVGRELFIGKMRQVAEKYQLHMD